ncbi:hypothetical protein JTB14_021350 [Gonioctena quinquepunctata]|nr:hypothetical protein JTB14_021350 [Gonioctena quinquepunctata]
MDPSTVSRIVVRVSEALAQLSPRYIHMPAPNNIIREQTKFYNVARFPRVLGVVDGTQIRIQSPGDSGYPLRNYFLTPLAEPNGRGQQLYNESLIRTRILIERTIGIWKRRFPILAYGSRLKESTTLTVIIATAVSHNIARDMNEPEPPVGDEIDINELNYLIDMGQMPDYLDAHNNINLPHHVQQHIINYFSNL